MRAVVSVSVTGARDVEEVTGVIAVVSKTSATAGVFDEGDAGTAAAEPGAMVGVALNGLIMLITFGLLKTFVEILFSFGNEVTRPQIQSKYRAWVPEVVWLGVWGGK